MKLTQAETEQREEALTYLRKILKPGDTVQTVLRSVSKSGMYRRIDLYTIKDGQMVYLSGYAGRVLGINRHPNKQGLGVSGCGMDMGFHLVYSLSHALFPKGFKTTKKTIHRNGTKNGERDNDGGYALHHEWI